MGSSYGYGFTWRDGAKSVKEKMERMEKTKKEFKPAFDDEAELCLRQVMTVTGEDVWERQKGIIATWLNTVSKRGK